LITIFKNYETQRRKKDIFIDETSKQLFQMKLNQSNSIGHYGQPSGLQDNQDNQLMQNKNNNNQNINIEMSEKPQKVDIK
jgi:hypothetical protein